MVFTSNQIENWIKKFKELHPAEIEDTFLNGNCYFFVEILQNRFGGTIYYLPIVNHFILKIQDWFFDIRGRIDPEEEPVLWLEYATKYRTEAKRINRDCIDWSEYINEG